MQFEYDNTYRVGIALLTNLVYCISIQPMNI